MFESNLPIGAAHANSIGKIRQHARNLPVLGYTAQADVGRVREGHEDGHTVTTEAQKVESLECRSEGSGADILDGPNALVGINHLVTDLKSHTGSPTNHRCQVLSHI